MITDNGELVLGLIRTRGKEIRWPLSCYRLSGVDGWTGEIGSCAYPYLTGGRPVVVVVVVVTREVVKISRDCIIIYKYICIYFYKKKTPLISHCAPPPPHILIVAIMDFLFHY